MQQKTQDLLDEVAAPKSGGSQAELSVAIEAFLPALTGTAQRAAQIHSMAQIAQMTEEDSELRARLELYVQRAAAIEKLRQEISNGIVRLHATLSALDREDAEFRLLAAERI